MQIWHSPPSGEAFSSLLCIGSKVKGRSTRKETQGTPVVGGIRILGVILNRLVKRIANRLCNVGLSSVFDA